MMSNNNLDQLAAAQKANAEVMMALLRTAFNGVERLTALNMAASREFFNNTVSNAQQLLGAKDASEAAKLGAATLSNAPATMRGTATAAGFGARDRNGGTRPSATAFCSSVRTAAIRRA